MKILRILNLRWNEFYLPDFSCGIRRLMVINHTSASLISLTFSFCSSHCVFAFVTHQFGDDINMACSLKLSISC